MADNALQLGPKDIIIQLARQLAAGMGWKKWGYSAGVDNAPLILVPVTKKDENGYEVAVIYWEDNPPGGVKIRVREVGDFYMVTVSGHVGAVDKFGKGCTCLIDRAVAEMTRA